MKSPAPLLELEGISHSYRMGDQRVPVLKDVSLTIHAGDLVAIKGASGSGKSTLLYVMGCLLRADSGQVRIDGRDVSRLSDERLAFTRNHTLGFVFQQFHLLPRASIVDNILLPASYPVEHAPASDPVSRERRRHRAEELARGLGLGQHLHHFPNQLSGGQQQRVAIARALMNDVRLILADEPTGNLDSASAGQIIELLREVNRAGRAVVIVTHDPAIAARCDRILEMKDGKFVRGESGHHPVTTAPTPTGDGDRTATGTEAGAANRKPLPVNRYLQLARTLFPLSLQNILRTKARSALTMLGIVIGISAVLAMVTIGAFAKRKILESYEELGVSKLDVRGWPNWQLKATDKVPFVFRQFDARRDISSLRRIFPEIRLLSPVFNTWTNSVDFGGRAITNGLRILGVGEQYPLITNRQLSAGRLFSPYNVESRAGVCLIGNEVAQQLFYSQGSQPLGQVIFVQGGNSAFGCKVIGVFKPQASSSEWSKPDLQILIPFTYFRSVTENWWDEQLHEVVMQLQPGVDVERLGPGIKNYLHSKYGVSGRFDVDSDAILIAQMKRFLNIFALLLGSIALISLIVGGIGITNMMLVSVTERYKEIGLRKAMGATKLSIRVQFLLETLILCVMAGLIGMVLGFAAYETMIVIASKLVPKLKFEWVVEPGALVLSIVSILGVGLASGLVPALKAEKLEVIEALRSE